MAIKSVNELKTYFETNDKPTQQQFWDWLESFIHKTDGIAIADVTNLQSVLNAKVEKAQFDLFEQGDLVESDANFTYNLPEGYRLVEIFILPGADATAISMEVQGGDQIINTEYDTTNEIVDQVSVYARTGPKSIDVTGVVAGSKFIFFKRKMQVL